MALDDVVPLQQIKAAAAATVASRYDRAPELILDKCLEDGTTELAELAAERSRTEDAVISEIITMPKRAHGVRPVQVLSTVDRLTYEALVTTLSPNLPAKKRVVSDWTTHTSYGIDPDQDNWVVDFDISACYEYIHHALLIDEVLLQTAQGAVSRELGAFLGRVSPRSLGLPQMLGASDQLADTFLMALQRRLARSNLDVPRYADDFRVVCKDEESANHAVEIASDESRRMGLSLSANKTRIDPASSLIKNEAERTDFIDRYRLSATEDLTVEEWFETAYGIRSEIVEPEEEDVIEGQFLQMLLDWDATEARDSLLTRMLSHALRTVENASDRVANRQLIAIALRHPLKMPDVLQYLAARNSDGEQNAEVLMELAGQKRLGPWARIHLLDAAGRVCTTGESADRFLAWAQEQLRSKSETVTATAAWYLSDRSGQKDLDLAAAYRRASTLSRPALTAALARRDLASERQIREAARNDGALNRIAFNWAQK